MNLWIRSQMKNNLVSADNFHVDFNDDNYMFVITCEKWDSEYCLGEYSTEEKALKVLDMIQKRITKINSVKRKFDCGEYVVVIDEENFVFQMPKDDEVKA